MQVLELNGVNVLIYVKNGGLSVTRHSVDGPSAGRNMDADMELDRIAVKDEIQVECRPLRQSETEILLPIIEQEWIYVRYLSPSEGIRSAYFYSNNIPAKALFTDGNGIDWWTGISFPLVEK